jgi:small subunit ribosomal protein S2
MSALADLEKLQANLGGVKHMTRPPDAVFIIDLKTEAIAVKEAQRLRIPIIGLVDTNCDPDGIQYVIPGNDDAIRSCTVVTKALGDVIVSGRSQWQKVEEERARKEAEAAAAREAEETARKIAEETARREAEEAAAREQAERVEEQQAEAAATRKANEPMERGAPGSKPHSAPTVAEDLPARPGPRGKKRKSTEGSGAGAPPSQGAAAAAKTQDPVAPATAEEVPAVDPAPTAGAVDTDPGSSESPGADAQAAAAAIVEEETPAAEVTDTTEEANG